MSRRNWTVIKVPYGGGYCSLNLAKPKDAKYAPAALQKEFKRQSVFIADSSISSWDNVAWFEIPLEFYQNSASDWEKMHKEILHKFNDFTLNSGKNVLFLGGSHSITASTYFGSSLYYSGLAGSKKSGLIVFDAHPDCCRKADWPIHSDWLRYLIENHLVLPENILLIGLRQMEKSEKEFLDKFNIDYYHASYIKNTDDLIASDPSTSQIVRRFRSLEAVYMSIDIDVASGAYAPGTGCPSPGGFTDKELIGLVKQFKNALPNLKAADIVEINPLKWWQKKVLRYDATVDLGVKLIKEIIS